MKNNIKRAIMKMTFTKKITKTELLNKVEKLIGKILLREEPEDYYRKEYEESKRDGAKAHSIIEQFINYIRKNDIIHEDLKGIDFDWENCSCDTNRSLDNWGGVHTMHTGLTFLACWAGGDWEQPVCFLLYWDGKDVRAFIPDKGNLYNRTLKRAYGNNEKSDMEDYIRYIRMVYGIDRDVQMPYVAFDEFIWNDSKFMMVDMMNKIRFTGKGNASMTDAQKNDKFFWGSDDDEDNT